jgi:lysophospholipase L1-like esterase
MAIGLRGRILASRAVRIVAFAALLCLPPAWLGPTTISQDVDVYTLARTLLSLESGAYTKVRVLHFGDSYVAGDAELAAMRGYLLSLWGDGGPGVGLPWTPPRGYRREGLSSGMTRGFERVQPTPSGPVTDTGLAGLHIEADAPGQAAWIEGYGAVVRVALLRQPGGGRFELRVNGVRVALPIESLDSAWPEACVIGQQARQTDQHLRVEIRTLDAGKVRVLGASIERAGPGLVYSPLGVVGQRAEALLKWRAETFERLLAAEDPDLVILAYGTNETAAAGFDVESGARVYTELIRRIQRGAPRALVLVVSAPDRGENRRGEWRTMSTVPAVVQAQREAARRTGAAFVDLFAAMGGSDSIVRWMEARPALARSDGTHFTAPGYAVLARAIVGGLVETYNRVKASPGFVHEIAGERALLAAASRRTLLGSAPPVLPAAEAFVRTAVHEPAPGPAG